VSSSIRKLVLLPGMDGTGELFDGFVKALPKEIQTITVRFLPDAVQSNDELLQLVQSAIPRSESFVLLAESFSTPLSIQYAAKSPPNLRGLILCAGFALSPLRGWRRWVGRSLTPFLFRGAVPAFAIRAFLVGSRAPSQLITAVREAISLVQPRVLRDRLRLVANCDVRKELARISVPILYLCAENDRLIPARCGAEIQRINSRTTVKLIAGPHLILQREPQECADEIARFVVQLGCKPEV
jgi:pimeloyl-[acyl-carrier protein] methyl ester esterase